MKPPRLRLLVVGLIILGILIAGFFGFRAIFAFKELRRHGSSPPLEEAFTVEILETDVELIRDWMTVPYVSRTYRVNPKALYDALGISPHGNEELSLLQLNEKYFPEQPGIVIELVKGVVLVNLQTPTAIPPETPATPSMIP